VATAEAGPAAGTSALAAAAGPERACGACTAGVLAATSDAALAAALAVAGVCVELSWPDAGGVRWATALALAEAEGLADAAALAEVAAVAEAAALAVAEAEALADAEAPTEAAALTSPGF